MKYKKKHMGIHRQTSMCEIAHTKYYSIQQAAKELGVAYRGLYRKVELGKVKTTRINGHRFISEIEVARLHGWKAIRLEAHGISVLVLKPSQIGNWLEKLKEGTWKVEELPPPDDVRTDRWIWECGEMIARFDPDNICCKLVRNQLPIEVIKKCLALDRYEEFSKNFIEAMNKDAFANGYFASW